MWLGSHMRAYKTHVTVNGEDLGFCFFADERDIALGLSTDGFSPFKGRKSRKYTAWPLLIINYNLPPEERFLKKNIICVGVIPGPKKPWDMDSFLYPMVEELLRLQIGVSTYDTLSDTLFLLRAYLIVAFGDIPAMSLLMRMKGHNALTPCRMCTIRGVRGPSGGSKRYDPAALPLRSHEDFLANAREIDVAPTEAQAERLRKLYGIKGTPLLSSISSLSFPRSFPYGFMHLIWENLIPNLVSLWTGDFKGLGLARGDGDGRETSAPFVIPQDAWEELGSICASASRTIPSAFGAALPNIASDRGLFTAEMWANFTLYLAPALLRDRFRDRRYYTHFLQLVDLLKICLQFEYSSNDIKTVKAGFAEWVKDFERLYYQYDPERLSMCPLTLHALLHIGDSMEDIGPVWATWEFPTERYCGILIPAVKSRRYPYASLNQYALDLAQLSQIAMRYGIEQELSLRPPRRGTNPKAILLSPHREAEIPTAVHTKIAQCLATRFDVTMAVARRYIPRILHQWGKVQRVDGGDMVHAADLVPRSEGGRDATYIRYQLLVDKYAHLRNRPSEYEPRDFYGQLRNIYVVDLPASRDLKTTSPSTLLLAAVRTVTTKCPTDLAMPFYRKEGPLEVIDLAAVQCVVGRVYDSRRNWWAIIDRSGPYAQAEFIDREPE
ncbi:hypothetical protein ACG7TL_005913 [Trametes sanguinea]